MEEEAVLGEMLPMAQGHAACGRHRHRAGEAYGNAQYVARKASEDSRILVDFVVVDRDQRQTYATYYDPSYSGELRIPTTTFPLSPSAAQSESCRPRRHGTHPRAICNLGAGVSTGLSTIAAEEQLLDAPS